MFLSLTTIQCVGYETCGDFVNKLSIAYSRFVGRHFFISLVSSCLRTEVIIVFCMYHVTDIVKGIASFTAAISSATFIRSILISLSPNAFSVYVFYARFISSSVIIWTVLITLFVSLCDWSF